MDPITILAILGGLGALGSGIGAFGASRSQGGSGFGGAPAQNLQIPRFTPQQERALNSLIGPSLKGLTQQYGQQGDLSNILLNRGLANIQQVANRQRQVLPGNFNIDAILNEARTGFNQKTIPTLAERFTSLGSGPSLSSPAFASQLGQAGAGLEGQLAALRANAAIQQQGFNAEQLNQQLNRQASLGQNLLNLGIGQRNQQQNLLQNLLSTGLTPQYENLYQQRQPGFLETAGTSLLQSLPSLLALSQFSNNTATNTQALPSTTSTIARTGLQGTPVQSSGYGFANPNLYSFL